ncbi:putative transposase [Trichonephila clavipes]|nr:putative transposase [Trichonephila clavipes]
MKKSANEAHRMLSNTYGEAAISERMGREWFQRFKNGDFDVEDQHGIWWDQLDVVYYELLKPTETITGKEEDRERGGWIKQKSGLKDVGVNRWRTRVSNRSRWSNLIQTALTRIGCSAWKEVGSLLTVTCCLHLKSHSRDVTSKTILRWSRRILFSDEAHFWLNGYINKQNCRIWSEANPQVYVETPLHPEKLTVWCALWAGEILLQKR